MLRGATISLGLALQAPQRRLCQSLVVKQLSGMVETTFPKRELITYSGFDLTQLSQKRRRRKNRLFKSSEIYLFFFQIIRDAHSEVCYRTKKGKFAGTKQQRYVGEKCFPSIWLANNFCFTLQLARPFCIYPNTAGAYTTSDSRRKLELDQVGIESFWLLFFTKTSVSPIGSKTSKAK